MGLGRTGRPKVRLPLEYRPDPPTLGGIPRSNSRIKASTSNPIYTLTNSTGDGQIYPRNGGPFGFNGGFWYVRASVKY